MDKLRVWERRKEKGKRDREGEVSRVRPQLETKRETDGQSLTVIVKVLGLEADHAMHVQQVREPYAECYFHLFRCETLKRGAMQGNITVGRKVCMMKGREYRIDGRR